MTDMQYQLIIKWWSWAEGDIKKWHVIEERLYAASIFIHSLLDSEELEFLASIAQERQFTDER